MKDESMKKQNFLQGAAILAAATLIVCLLYTSDAADE